MTFWDLVTYYDDCAINGIPKKELGALIEEFPQVFNNNARDDVRKVYKHLLDRECINVRFHYGEQISYTSLEPYRPDKPMPGCKGDFVVIWWRNVDPPLVITEDESELNTIFII